MNQTEKQNKKYLEAFFEEKEITYELFEIKDKADNFHIINTEVVIEFIQEMDDTAEVVRVLRKLDFHNAPMKEFHKFLRYVAKYIVSLYEVA